MELEKTRSKKKKRRNLAADKCRCGHRRDQHGISHSINYTEGPCMACRGCPGFVIK